MNLKINFENCYSVVINNIYYNKIFSEQMQVYQDENTKTIFYLIPSQDTPFSFNICEINPELKNLVIFLIVIYHKISLNLMEYYICFNINKKIL